MEISTRIEAGKAVVRTLGAPYGWEAEVVITVSGGPFEHEDQARLDANRAVSEIVALLTGGDSCRSGWMNDYSQPGPENQAKLAELAARIA